MGSGGPVQIITLTGLSLWFFRNCLGFRETLRTYELHFPASGCTLHPSLCLGWAPWVIPCYVFSWLAFLERGCGVICFRHRFCGENSGPSLAPRFVGFTVPAQPTRDNRNGRLISCAGGRGFLGPLRLRIVSDASGSLLPQGVTGRSYRRPLFPSSSGCRCHGGAASRPRNGLFRVR